MNRWLVIGSICAVSCVAALRAEGPPAAEGERIVRIPFRSSTVVSAGFVRDSKILEIEFHSGAIYRYRNVPESVYAAFLAAQSKGRFFGGEIRGKFAFEKLKGPKK